MSVMIREIKTRSNGIFRCGSSLVVDLLVNSSKCVVFCYLFLLFHNEVRILHLLTWWILLFCIVKVEHTTPRPDVTDFVIVGKYLKFVPGELCPVF